MPRRPELEDLPARPRLRVGLGIVKGEVVLQSVVVDPSKSFHNVEGGGMWMSHLIEPGFIVQTDCIDDQRIPDPPADGIAHPTGIQIPRMLRSVCIDLADVVIVLKNHEYFARR